jgi:hypothetical protein
MDFSFLKGKRFWLFMVIGATGAIQAIQPMVGEQSAGVFTAVLALLGVLKTFFPYEGGSGEIDRLGK